MKNEFPKYYIDKRIGLYHKLETVDSVNIEKEKIYYRGIIMQHFGNRCNIYENCTFTHAEYDGWEEITETEFNSEYYLMKEIAQQSPFPKYYRSSNCYSVYKCNCIDYVDPTTKRVFYQGEIVCYYPDSQGINENAIFDLPKINCEITEKEFNDAYKSVKKALEPKYFRNARNGNWLHVKNVKSCGDETVYTGTVINPHTMCILGDVVLDENDMNYGGWNRYTKESYENAFNKIINKIK